MKPANLTLLITLTSLSFAAAAQAQTLEDRLRSQLVSTVSQLRALQASQADLTAQKDAAEKASAGLKAQLAKAQAELAAARRAPRPVRVAAPESDQDKAELAQLAQAHAQDQAALVAARADRGRVDQSGAALQAEHDKLTASLAADEQGLVACHAKNLQAIAVAKEILDAYDQITFGRVLARKEPFTGLERVKIQDLSQDYGDRIYHSRLDVTPRPPTPTAQPALSATPVAPSQ